MEVIVHKNNPFTRLQSNTCIWTATHLPEHTTDAAYANLNKVEVPYSWFDNICEFFVAAADKYSDNFCILCNFSQHRFT